MSEKKCCVPKCNVTHHDGITLHCFPNPEKNADRFRTWLYAIGGDVLALDNQFIYKSRRVCHKHFELKYQTWTKRLSPNAVPTLHLPGNDIVGIFHTRTAEPMAEITSVILNTEMTVLESNVPSTSRKTSGAAEPMAEADVSSVKCNTEFMDPEVNKPSTSTGCQAEDEPLPSTSTAHGPAAPAQAAAAVKRTNKKAPTAGIIFKDGNHFKRLLQKVTRKKDNYAARLKKALKLSENRTFQDTLKKFTCLSAIFMTMQFREAPKKKMARRFTEQEKIMALSIYKNGPKCYRFLKKFFVLPSPLTLSRLIARANIRAGLNKKLFKVLSKKIQNMTTDDKLCTLLFDEISITPHFDYNQRKDRISGFVTDGKTTQRKICDHALVFMIRGVLRNYKQPVAYTFCSGSTKKETLAVLIKDIIREIHGVGLSVLTTVCDQGASNVSAVNYLIAETRGDHLREGKPFDKHVFEVDKKEVIPLYDPPHLLKGIRNNLLEKNLKCLINGSIMVAKWDHVIKLHEEDPEYLGIRLLKKLTNDHVHPEKSKMKVKLATQVLSAKVASTMGYLAKKHILPEECQQTADVLLFFDKLFDSLNGSQTNSKKRRGKPLLCQVTPSSAHNAFWTEAKQVLHTMQYIKNGKESKVPSLVNFQQTIKNVEYLRDTLFKKYCIKSIWMRHYNQDPLENFFGCIRSHGCRNISPSPDGFETAFASLLLNNLTGRHSPGSNCEDDDCSSLFKSMKDLFKSSENLQSGEQEIDLSYMEDNIIVDYDLKKNDPRILAQLEYVSGYLIKKVKFRVFRNCVCCNKCFYDKKKSSEFLRARDYKDYLSYPTNMMLKMFSQIQDILTWVLKKHSHIDNLKMYAKTILFTEINTNFIKCHEHKIQNIDLLFDLSCRFFIFNWCKDVNNIMQGRVSQSVDGDSIKMAALDYVRKRRKVAK